MICKREEKLSSSYVIDIEADGLLLSASKIWCVVLKNIETNEIHVFDRYFYPLKVLLSKADKIIGHNIIGYDLPVLERILGIKVPLTKVFDTFVLSRLANYPREPGHALADFGTILNFPKKDYNDFSKYTPEMLEYCINDVQLTHKVYDLIKHELRHFTQESIDIEQEATFWLTKEQIKGFPINVPKLKELDTYVTNRLTELEQNWHSIFPPILVEDRRLKLKKRKDGSYGKVILRTIEENITKEINDELIVYKFQEFNPRSPKQLVERLNEFGWKPFIRTKTANQKLRRPEELTPDEIEHYKTHGWKVNEDNLNTLPESAPKEAHSLKEFLILNGRKNKLNETFPSIGKDNALHSTTFSIGSDTHRCSHIGPNKANFPATRSLLGEPFRECFTVPNQDYELIGTDADAIQLRLLSHFMGDRDYVESILKEDPHWVHTKKLKLVPPYAKRDKSNKAYEAARDKTKTFFYAWTFGAGAGLISNLLKCSIAEAYDFIEAFYEALPAIRELKEVRIKNEFLKGYHLAVDGRRIPFTSEHKALSVYLQGNEAIIMKHAMNQWNRQGTERNYDFWQVAFVHDEWQTVSHKSCTKQIIELQHKALKEAGEHFNLIVPISGNSVVGNSWAETH